MTTNNLPARSGSHRSIWQKRTLQIALLLLTPVILLTAVLVVYQYQANASSHREAPLISKDAFADNTDTYVFISPENDDNLVMIGSWLPFSKPEGGPNYYEWDDRVLYDIYVDSDGDASPNITYTLSSRVEVQNPSTFLYSTGPIESLDSANWNRRQFISVTETLDDGTVNVLVADQLTAPQNIGSKSTPDWMALESQAIRTAGGGKIYAGPTDDAFWVDLQVFDLLTLRGQEPPIGYTTGNNIPVDSVAGYNVHSLVIELPISRLTSGDETVLGVWSTARRSTMSVMMDEDPEYQQVSRLGMPLVNEVVIPMALKDVFNTLRPEQDAGVYLSTPLFQESVENPEVGRLLCALYGVPMPGTTGDSCDTNFTAGDFRSGRGDIVDIFLQGMVLAAPFTIQTADGPMELPAGFNVNRPDGVQPAEMIRINTAIKGNLCHPEPSRLGILGGDACGYPNGRRLMDDTVEISLLAVAGAAYGVLDGRDSDFAFNPAFIDVLDDGLDTNDYPFRTTFPYMAPANSGQERVHDNPFVSLFTPHVQKARNLWNEIPRFWSWGASESL